MQLRLEVHVLNIQLYSFCFLRILPSLFLALPPQTLVFHQRTPQTGIIHMCLLDHWIFVLSISGFLAGKSFWVAPRRPRRPLLSPWPAVTDSGSREGDPPPLWDSQVGPCLGASWRTSQNHPAGRREQRPAEGEERAATISHQINQQMILMDTKKTFPKSEWLY